MSIKSRLLMISISELIASSLTCLTSFQVCSSADTAASTLSFFTRIFMEDLYRSGVTTAITAVSAASAINIKRMSHFRRNKTVTANLMKAPLLCLFTANVSSRLLLSFTLKRMNLFFVGLFSAEPEREKFAGTGELVTHNSPLNMNSVKLTSFFKVWAN